MTRHYKRYRQFEVAEILPHIGKPRKRFYSTSVQKLFWVRMGSQRMKLLGRTQTCACCGLEGSYFWLENNSQGAHFNLYGLRYGREIMLTMDHIVPRSKGGKTHPENIQLLCARCNSIKGKDLLSIEELKKVVQEWKPNPPKIRMSPKEHKIHKAKRALEQHGDKIPADRRAVLEKIASGK